MDFISTVAIAVVFWVWGAFSGWNAREHHAQKKMQKITEALQELAEEEEQDRIHIVFEKHEGLIFCYDKTTSRFMAQGSSVEEIQQTLSELFPGKRFAASEQDLREVGFRL
jgi:hypothetical protein